MPRKDDETEDQFIARIVSLNATEAEDELGPDDQILRIQKKRERRDKAEADRKAKAEADRKAEEEADRKAKEAAHRKAKEQETSDQRKDTKSGTEPSGSGEKDTEGKPGELGYDQVKDQPIKKTKTPCDNCLKKKIDCIKKDGRGKSCASCHSLKLKCERSSESEGIAGSELLDEKLCTVVSLFREIREYQKIHMLLAYGDRAEAAPDKLEEEMGKGKGKRA
ncbi:hypothetical protein C8R47DRAFT_1136926 [Mycena vitilis]|nr:hypothetical protein C8R47DRAFT_1136926 [Mycena vitilis]